MPPDNEVESNQATGDRAEEFGRVSVDPSPTKQDLSKYDLLFVPDNIAIRCIGCMEYIWEYNYPNSLEIPIVEVPFELLVNSINEHHLKCTYWNK